jgi:hypothetical protein
MVRRASGRTETAYSKADETELRARGYELLHEQVEFQEFPMWLEGDGLPPLLVEDQEAAQAAAAAGYRLPSDAEIETAEEGFVAAFAPQEERYTPSEYPKVLRHPTLHRDAIATTWTYDIDGVGTAIPGSPEEYPDVIVNSPAEERAWLDKGWSSPSPHIAEPPAPSQPTADELAEFRAWKRSGGQPRRTKMSGYQRRKLAKERAAQADLAGAP